MVFFDYKGLLERIKRRHWYIESVHDQVRREKGIQLGYTGPIGMRRNFAIRGKELFTHKHIIGKTGYGKSNLLAGMAKQLIEQNIPVILLDPHADLANGLLHSLYDSGYFERPDVKPDPTKKLLYFDFDITDEQDNPLWYLPFNVLKQPYDKYKVARNFVETCRRVWPYLEEGAPQFENILLYSIIILIDNDLPLPQIETVLSDKAYRDSLLQNVSDPAVASFFHNRYDNWGRDGYKMIESTLNKITLLTFSPVLRYSLGQKENALNFHEIINSGASVIFNIGMTDEESRRFLSCLLTIGLEQAVFARKNMVVKARKEIFVFIDEFQDSVSTSQKTFNFFLSEARKYKGRLVLAHQYLAQLPLQLVDALQNTQRISLRLEDDAQHMAERIIKRKLGQTMHEVEDEFARKRTHPRFKTAEEELIEWENEIKSLYVGEGLIKLENRTEKFKSLKFPDPVSSLEAFNRLKQWYAQRLMVHRDEVVPTINNIAPTPKPVTVGRIRRERG